MPKKEIKFYTTFPFPTDFFPPFTFLHFFSLQICISADNECVLLFTIFSSLLYILTFLSAYLHLKTDLLWLGFYLKKKKNAGGGDNCSHKKRPGGDT